jgi:hypothetical protein
MANQDYESNYNKWITQLMNQVATSKIHLLSDETMESSTINHIYDDKGNIRHALVKVHNGELVFDDKHYIRSHKISYDNAKFVKENGKTWKMYKEAGTKTDSSIIELEEGAIYIIFVGL